MSSRRILVLGGGFAGLWSAVGAARKLNQLGVGSNDVAITLVNRDPYHCIRVRNYEIDLRPVRVRLDDVLEPVGIQRIEGEVVDVDVQRQEVRVKLAASADLATLGYDRLVFALGSELNRPNIPGFAEHAFDVDTYGGGASLKSHPQALPKQSAPPRPKNRVFVGTGLNRHGAAPGVPWEIATHVA